MTSAKKIMSLGVGILTLTALLNFASEKQLKIENSSLKNSEKAKTALLNQLPEQTEILPTSEKNLSHMLFLNTTDGEERAVVPYRNDNSKKPLKLMILKKYRENWVEDMNLSLLGESFDEILFEDINGDRNPEIITGVKMGESTTKGLSIYSYQDKRFKQIFNDNYEKLFFEDLDNDDMAEMLLIQKTSIEGEAEVKYYGYRDGKLKLIDSLDLGKIGDESEIKFEKLNSSKSGLVVQTKVAEGEHMIRVLKVEANGLQELKLNQDKPLINPIKVGVKTENQSLEIPVLKKSPKLGTESGEVWITEWHRLKSDFTLELSSREYIDYDTGFSFQFSKAWDETTGVKRIIGQAGELNAVEFNRYINPNEYEKLLEIKLYSNENWTKKSKEGRKQWEIIAKSSKHVYVLNQTLPDAEMEDIKSRFKILDFEGKD